MSLSCGGGRGFGCGVERRAQRSAAAHLGNCGAFYKFSDFQPALGQSACWWAIAQFIRDAMFACPVEHTAATLAGLPGRVNGAATFAYSCA